MLSFFLISDLFPICKTSKIGVWKFADSISNATLHCCSYIYVMKFGLPLICRLIIVIIVNLLICRQTTLDFVFEDLTLRSEVLVGNIGVRLLQAKEDAVLLLLLRLYYL